MRAWSSAAPWRFVHSAGSVYLGFLSRYGGAGALKRHLKRPPTTLRTVGGRSMCLYRRGGLDEGSFAAIPYRHTTHHRAEIRRTSYALRWVVIYALLSVMRGFRTKSVGAG